MAGYRRVNYYELCRLCTSSEGTKMHIFREEGRRRSLPSKIQTCLPLQVQEEDALPKIICSSCVEKLENYFEFRESCINAEAMLESYFTSLRYSDDFPREGKVSVYVKDEPPKKKDESAPGTTKLKIPVSSIGTGTTMVNSSSADGSISALQPTAIQILTDPDGNHLTTQYKVQVQGGVPSLVPYGGQSGLPLGLAIPALHAVKPATSIASTTTSINGTIATRADDSTQTTEAHLSQQNQGQAPPPPPLVAAVTITPQGQDIVHQFGINTKDRNTTSITQLNEMLKLKNINVIEAGAFDTMHVGTPTLHSGQVSNLVPAQIRLDPAQLSQLISANANLHINLSPLQDVNTKVLNITTNRSVMHMTTKPESKSLQTVDDQRGQTTTQQHMNNSDLGATNPDVIMTRMNEQLTIKANALQQQQQQVAKQAEVNLKYEETTSNGLDLEPNLEDDIEEVLEENSQGGGGEENQTYDCDSCNKTFKRKEHLFQHRKSHSGERPFVCGTCGKAFSRKEHLLRHNVSHTGQKMYGCDVCHKSFSRKDNLHKHKKTHGISGPHVCETCGKSFVVKHYYMMHKAQHEGQVNTETATGAPVKHLTSTNSTVNPLPHRCDLCSKSFSMKQYLDSHRLRHRGKQVKQEPSEVSQVEPQQQQHHHHQQHVEASSADITIPQPTILTSYPANLTTLNTGLTTINPSALLAPNIIHHSGANMVQIGNTSYLCTSNVTTELLEQYRRLHAS